jgi:hypothetical protein
MMMEEERVAYCERAGTCVCHGYRCCDPPQGRTQHHCYTHNSGCHKGRRCRKKPGRKKKAS